MSLLHYEQQFAQLKMNGANGQKSPHKVAMLLAVMQLIETGQLSDNIIEFNQTLITAFSQQFARLAGSQDRNTPHLPFFHLRSSDFWHHQAQPGLKQAYEQLSTAGSNAAIKKHIRHAYLDASLFELLQNAQARALLRAALQQNLTVQQRKTLLSNGNHWNWLECEAAVASYFTMLSQTLRGRPVDKTHYRMTLQAQLPHRNHKAIEFKHCNISAVLTEMGQPYIPGYEPLANYQQQLKDTVFAYLAGHQDLFEHWQTSAKLATKTSTSAVNWADVYDAQTPKRLNSIQPSQRPFLAHKTNFAELERSNRQLGEYGETFVLHYERYRLQQAGRPDLANEVAHHSKELGDGLGYDVRSFDLQQNKELFIEVKTTNSGKQLPFYISANEVAFSQAHPQQYSLYRVYNFAANARIFTLYGAVDQHVHLQAQNYSARFH